jgi:hypothetical protein
MDRIASDKRRLPDAASMHLCPGSAGDQCRSAFVAGPSLVTRERRKKAGRENGVTAAVRDTTAEISFGQFASGAASRLEPGRNERMYFVPEPALGSLINLPRSYLLAPAVCAVPHFSRPIRKTGVALKNADTNAARQPSVSIGRFAFTAGSLSFLRNQTDCSFVAYRTISGISRGTGVQRSWRSSRDRSLSPLGGARYRALSGTEFTDGTILSASSVASGRSGLKGFRISGHRPLTISSPRPKADRMMRRICRQHVFNVTP